jgi:DUF1365 family protein
MSGPAAQLWFGRTLHRRERPFVRAFSYRIAMLELDIDRLEEADGLSRLLSIEHGNIVSFRPTDHGARKKTVPLRLWAEARFAEAGIKLDGGAIRLLTFPRVLGHGFAPISLWFGYGPDGGLRGVLYEVHNTFGEAHCYASALGSEAGRWLADEAGRAVADKEFFVSPFFDVSGTYRFTLRRGPDRMELVVENLGADGRDHVASMALRPQPLTSRAILRWLVLMPISGLGVVFAIYWQALRLWLKGARYRAKSIQRARRTTLAGLDAKLSSKEEWLSSKEEWPAVAHELRKRA